MLSEQALNGLIDEFITRDSVVWDATLEVKREHVRKALANERAFIVFDEDSETTHILTLAEYQAAQKD